MSEGRVSCIARPARTRYVILWPGYVEIADGNVCAALLLAVFEFWTNVKLSDAEELGGDDDGLWVYRSRDELAADLCGAFGRDAIDTALKLLLEKGLIERRNNPDKGWDRKLQYRLNVEAAQAAFPMDAHCRESDDASQDQPDMGEPAEAPETSTPTDDREPDNGSTTHSRISGYASSDIRPSIVGNPTSNTEEPKKNQGTHTEARARVSSEDRVARLLGEIAVAKHLPPPARDHLRRILRSYSDRDVALEAEKFHGWALEGAGRSAELTKGVTKTFASWLSRSPKRGEQPKRPRTKQAVPLDHPSRRHEAELEHARAAQWVAENLPGLSEAQQHRAITSYRRLKFHNGQEPSPEEVRNRVLALEQREARKEKQAA